MLSSYAPPEPVRSLQIATAKKKRRPAGTPDPDAEVVALSPRALMESYRFVCDICGQRFQRDRYLQLHRRTLHNVAPSTLLKRKKQKQVFVCPEPSCLRHDPSHALGDLTGIKKHFRRKHGGQRQWACARCSAAYALYTDFLAHLRTCGTRDHVCDHCGRAFSRRARFIEHQRSCNPSRPRPAETAAPPDSGAGVGLGVAAPAAASTSHQLHADAVEALMLLPLPRTASSARPSSGDLAASPTAAAAAANVVAAFRRLDPALAPPTPSDRPGGFHNVELQLMPPRGSCGPRRAAPAAVSCCAAPPRSATVVPQLELSMWFGGARDDGRASASAAGARLKEEAREQLRLAMVAKEAWAQARRQAEVAELELAVARRVRQQAQAEFSRAHAVRQVDATLPQVTCYRFRH